MQPSWRRREMAMSATGLEHPWLGHLILFGALLSACSHKSSLNNTTNVDENLVTTDMNSASTDVPTALPSPNYADKDGRIYEYISAVSDEDAKKGKAVGDVILYAFRGVSNGSYRLSSVDNDGHAVRDFECTNPCGVIKVYWEGQLVDRIPYSSRTVIGSAFEDAFNGFLVAAKEPRKALASTNVPPAASHYSSSPSNDAQPEVSDANDNEF